MQLSLAQQWRKRWIDGFSFVVLYEIRFGLIFFLTLGPLTPKGYCVSFVRRRRTLFVLATAPTWFAILNLNSYKHSTSSAIVLPKVKVIGQRSR